MAAGLSSVASCSRSAIYHRIMSETDLRVGVPRGMTPEEIEDMINGASDEARRERLARCSVTETR